MGHCSNQWLNTGYGLRESNHAPTPVTIEAETPADDWSEEHKVVIEIRATREGGEYMEFYLTKSEAEKCAQAFLNECSEKVRERLLLRTMKGMTASKLLEILTSILKTRLGDGSNGAKK